MNIENTLNNAVKILNKSKIKNSILDSEILLSQVINRDRKYIFLNSKENLKFLVKESQTPKGLNEQGVKELTKAGFYKSLEKTPLLKYKF